ncbi:hypothetical protein TomTYG75_05240 [Sphingobium sp. TomTYG75]
MSISSNDYMPVLKWRQGEYQGLMRLHDPVKDRTVPLIEVTPPDFDFELQKPTKTIDEHIGTFASRLDKKWGKRRALLDCSLLPPAMRMSDGRHPMLYLGQEIVATGRSIIPVVRLTSDPDYRQAVYWVDAQTLGGVALRCNLDEAVDPDFDTQVDDLVQELGIDLAGLDLVLDLAAPTWEPESGLVALIMMALSGANTFAQARSVTIVGSSFPDSMGMVTGPIQFWPRREWAVYRALLAALPLGARRPGFGDYTIAGPGFAQGDMRLLKPSATIRYACNDGWIIAKGSNVRDNGFAQYQTCSGTITTSPLFLGAHFSRGSAYIDGCRLGTEKTGNLTTWRWVGTNQHITKAVSDLASLSWL